MLSLRIDSVNMWNTHRIPNSEWKILWHHNRWKTASSACICFGWLLIFHHGKSPSNHHLEKIAFTLFKHLKQIQEEDSKKTHPQSIPPSFIFIGFPEDKIDLFPGWWHVFWRENREDEPILTTVGTSMNAVPFWPYILWLLQCDPFLFLVLALVNWLALARGLIPDSWCLKYLSDLW